MKVKHLVALLLAAWVLSAIIMTFLGHLPEDLTKEVYEYSFIENFTVIGLMMSVIIVFFSIAAVLIKNWDKKII